MQLDDVPSSDSLPTNGPPPPGGGRGGKFVLEAIRSQDGLKMAPRCSKFGQSRPKMVPRGPHMARRWPQELKMSPR